jgi:hypothetical protein
MQKQARVSETTRIKLSVSHGSKVGDGPDSWSIIASNPITKLPQGSITSEEEFYEKAASYTNKAFEYLAMCCLTNPEDRITDLQSFKTCCLPFVKFGWMNDLWDVDERAFLAHVSEYWIKLAEMLFSVLSLVQDATHVPMARMNAIGVKINGERDEESKNSSLLMEKDIICQELGDDTHTITLIEDSPDNRDFHNSILLMDGKKILSSEHVKMGEIPFRRT